MVSTQVGWHTYAVHCLNELLMTSHSSHAAALTVVSSEKQSMMMLACYPWPAGLADYDGRTALHLAASEGHKEIVAYLIVEVTLKAVLTMFVCIWHDLRLGR